MHVLLMMPRHFRTNEAAEVFFLIIECIMSDFDFTDVADRPRRPDGTNYFKVFLSVLAALFVFLVLVVGFRSVLYQLNYKNIKRHQEEQIRHEMYMEELREGY